MNEKKSPEKAEKKKRSYKKWLLIIWLLFIIPIGSIYTLFYLISEDYFGKLPSLEELENPKSNLATEVYFDDGTVMGKYFKENRSTASYNEISPWVFKALVATEDERFFEHSGIDFMSIPRVIMGLVTGSTSKGGGSTVSQQLAKMLFPREDLNLIELVFRKFKEWVIAVRLERQYTKEEIMVLYLNQFDFINNAVGIKSAAQVYFSKTPDSLNIQESALLVGMLKNPALFNPRRFEERCTNRRSTVLGQMVRNNVISDSLRDALDTTKIDLHYSRVDHKLGLAPYFRESLRGELKKIFSAKDAHGNYKYRKADGSPYNIYRDGLRVYTTINPTMQRYAEEAVKSHLGGELQEDFWNHIKRKKNPPFANDVKESRIGRILESAKRRTPLYRELQAQGMSKDSIDIVFNTPVETTVFSWNGEIDTVMTPMEEIHYKKCFLQTGMMSVDPKTGFIKAWVGGIDFKHFSYDHVFQSKRQVGSTIKPFVYASLFIERGREFGPCYEIPNQPYTFYKGEYGILKDWTPHNPGREYGYKVSLKYGLANSMNTITAWAMRQISPQHVADFMKQAGLKSDIEPVPALCLGVADISVYEMVGAYASFANRGRYLEPIYISRIEDKNGNLIVDMSLSRRQTDLISEENAYAMLKLMEGVTSYNYNADLGKHTGGTGIRLRFSKEIRPYGGIPKSTPIAGKTGTTQGQSDGWFIGITPDLVTGVWVGAQDRDVRFTNLSKGSGTNMALPIWGYYMNDVYDDSTITVSKGPFERPEGTLSIKVDCDTETNEKDDNPFGNPSGEPDFGGSN